MIGTVPFISWLYSSMVLYRLGWDDLREESHRPVLKYHDDI